MRRPRSVSTAIVMMTIATALSITMLVGWTIVISTTASFSVVLLVGGILSFVFIMTVLLLSGIALVNEILEVRRQNSFIDSVTHELKSPLASLRLGLETLDRPNLNHRHRDQVHRMMINDVERLSGFIDDVLEASRLAHRSGALAVTMVDLSTLLANSGAKVRERYADRDVELVFDVPDDVQLRSDPTALEIIVKNLIDNAIKYSDEPATVSVRYRLDENARPVIEVEDRGIGIPKEARSRIFKRFYRVDSEAVRTRNGTGLGLFVVASLARAIGGTVSADEARGGQGTMMRLTLPIDKQGTAHDKRH
ncbi:MAG: HAMP domain-containing histidine kinase [Myxococcales bacterium]|nr:HAMP domain-containing histidine kinase [Myxococcales bacterium]